MKWFRKLQSNWKLPGGVLGILVGVAIISIGLSFFDNRVSWGSLLQNFGTEMAGAIAIYFLLEIFLGIRQKKEVLIEQMGSKLKDTAINATDELRKKGWLVDGALEGANLEEANLEGASLWRANLTHAYLGQANLKNAHLLEANLQSTRLIGANLQGAYLREANLQRAILRKANLQNTDFRYAILRDADFFNADLSDAVFRNAILERVDFGEAILLRANLEGSDLTDVQLNGAKYNSDTKWPGGFDPKGAGAILVNEGNPVEQDA